VSWILRWCALPLQRPGTKLATAIIMHGAEGTGKNMFWDVLKQIYGPYGTIIGQAQIESDFNGWLSARLFVIGNEVLGRKEKWELRGALKHMVTEDVIHINEKNMRERVERNHVNLVFLSNEVQPLAISHGDRRYLVVDCWAEHPEGKSYYDRVKAEINAGGIDAFYDYLLKLPLGDFTAHTKPIVTAAKRELVELGRDDSERFLEHWKQGLLAVPYGAAPFDELYTQLRRWCQAEGERHIPTKTRFGRLARIRLKSKVTRAHGVGGYSARQKTVYWDEEAVPDTCEDLDGWLKERCQAFLQAMAPDDEEGQRQW
jgi:putative DNA primase/helicase